MIKKAAWFMSVFSLSAIPAFAAAVAPYEASVSCSGYVRSTKISDNLQFDDVQFDKQDLAVINGITYSIQLGSYRGKTDMILWMGTKDSSGAIIAGSLSWIRAFGASELQYSNAPNGTYIDCTLSEY